MKRDSTYFGQDPVNVPVLLKDLAALARTHQDVHWGALIDTAFDYPAVTETPYWNRRINCYDSPEYDGLDNAAPILVPFEITNDHSFLTQLLRHCHNRPMISFLASDIPLEKLCDVWRSLHWITAADTQRMLLRLADTRTLTILPKVLSPAQWAAFSGPVTKWVALNREGGLISLAPAKLNETKAKSIHLDHDQLGVLLAASEPDNILSLISDSMSDIIPHEMQGSQRYEIVYRSCALAREHNVENWADVVSLSVAAFLTEGSIFQNELLTAHLIRRQWSEGDLGTSLIAERFL